MPALWDYGKYITIAYFLGKITRQQLDEVIDSGITTDPEKSGMVAQQTQDTDQYKYLYFYVGNFTQTALENTAGVTTEVLNGKVDKGHQVVEFQAPTSANGYTWYRKYADGWVEQGGRSTGLDRTITLPITMSDANYVIITELVGAISWAGYSHAVQDITTTGFRCWYDGDQIDPSNWSWQVSGMAA